MMSKSIGPPSAKKRCFVISPIGDKGSPERRHADMVLNSIIKPALPDFEIKRADDFGTPDMITDRVVEAIIAYELVVADLTGRNPNVFYEIGLRHMLAKPIIQSKEMVQGYHSTMLPSIPYSTKSRIGIAMWRCVRKLRLPPRKFWKPAIKSLIP